jgi:predicted DNA-binding protein (MmcQ/YjbR family)
MDLDAIRAFCLSFPRATENLQWGEELCFKVGGKLFAVVGLGSVPQRITFKCSPETFAEFTEREGITPAAYVGRYKWVTLEHLDVLPESDLRDAISQSYGTVAAKTKPANRRAKSRKQRSRTAK